MLEKLGVGGMAQEPLIRPRMPRTSPIKSVTQLVPGITQLVPGMTWRTRQDLRSREAKIGAGDRGLGGREAVETGAGLSYGVRERYGAGSSRLRANRSSSAGHQKFQCRALFRGPKKTRSCPTLKPPGSF